MSAISRPAPYVRQAMTGILVACAMTIAICWRPTPVLAQASAPTGPTASGPICRFGVNVSTQPVANFDVAALRVGWYVDNAANASAPRPGGAAYVPVVNLSQVGESDYTAEPSIGPALDAAIAGNRGATWIIGNEPDRRLYQNDMRPAAYAHAYHDLYAEIKRKDPTARIFAGAIVQPTPLRLEYLNAVLAAYDDRYGEPMPVDGWTIHNYILNERSCKYYNDPAHKPPDYDGSPDLPYNGSWVCWGADIPPGSAATDGLIIHLSAPAKTADAEVFKQQVVGFRQWMYDHGYADKPLYLSEFSILMPAARGFPVATVNQYMTDTFNFLLTQTDATLGYPADGHRLVQRFSWYSTLDIGFNGSLFESVTTSANSPPFQLSAIGANYRNYTAPIAVSSQLSLQALNLTPRAPLASAGPVTFTLSAVVANAGNSETPAQATVRFYDGDPAAGGIRIGTDQVVSLPGCGAVGTAQVQWPNIALSAAGRPVFAQLLAGGVNQQIEKPVFFAECFALALTHAGSGADPTLEKAEFGTCPAGQFAAGETVTLRAAPDNGWRVFGWDGMNNNASRSAANTLTMPTAKHTASVTYRVTPPAGGDDYEVDNACEQAVFLPTDGSRHEHTFDAAGDIDWVGFNAVAGATYRVEALVDDTSTADVDLELYTTCAGAPAANWKAAFTPNARLKLVAPATGPIYARLSTAVPATSGQGARYRVAVRVLDTPSSNHAAIIAGGRLKQGDPLQTNIDHVTAAAYRLLQGYGYADDAILYLATDVTLPGFDAAATKANLQSAILGWAAKRLSAGGMLTLYFVDHGKGDLLYLDEVNGQRLGPDELNDWLAQLEQAIPDLKVNVIYEAGGSGSFIEAPGSLSKPGRFIMTSSDANAEAKASRTGAYFSDHLITWLRQGYSLGESFAQARRVASQLFATQDAWLDANGNGFPNEPADAAIAAQRGFAGGFGDANWAPHIFAVTAPAAAENQSGEIRADVRDDVGVGAVWGVVYPPGYTLPATVGELHAETLPTFALAPTGQPNEFAGVYTGFTQAGAYRIVVLAEDREGMVGDPVAVEVITGSQLFLPAVNRQP